MSFTGNLLFPTYVHLGGGEGEWEGRRREEEEGRWMRGGVGQRIMIVTCFTLVND